MLYYRHNKRGTPQTKEKEPNLIILIATAHLLNGFKEVITMLVKKIDTLRTARCFTDCGTFLFQLLEVHETETGIVVAFAQCVDNDKYAWLDENGMSFEGEDRIEAEYDHTSGMDCFSLWGGVLRPKYNWKK